MVKKMKTFEEDNQELKQISVKDALVQLININMDIMSEINSIPDHVYSVFYKKLMALKSRIYLE